MSQLVSPPYISVSTYFEIIVKGIVYFCSSQFSSLLPSLPQLSLPIFTKAPITIHRDWSAQSITTTIHTSTIMVIHNTQTWLTSRSKSAPSKMF